MQGASKKPRTDIPECNSTIKGLLETLEPYDIGGATANYICEYLERNKPNKLVENTGTTHCHWIMSRYFRMLPDINRVVMVVISPKDNQRYLVKTDHVTFLKTQSNLVRNVRGVRDAMEFWQHMNYFGAMRYSSMTKRKWYLESHITDRQRRYDLKEIWHLDELMAHHHWVIPSVSPGDNDVSTSPHHP
jgi:hypothetical protein